MTGATRAEVETALAGHGHEVPGVAAPLAAYQPAVVAGGFVYTAGQLPVVAGDLTARGPVGPDGLALTDARSAARICALNALAAGFSAVGDGARLRLVKVVVFVNATAGFTDHPAVADGASELFGSALGEAGVHARSAVGVVSLPKNAAVELDAVFEIVDTGAEG
mgnify:FL=1